MISASRKGAGAPTPALLTGTVTFTHFVIRVQLFRDQLSWLGLPRCPWLNGRFHWKRGSPLSRVDLHPWRRGSDHAHAFPDDRQRSRRSLSKLRPVGEKSDPDSRLIRFWSKTPGTWARCRTCHPNNFNFAVNAWIAAISSPWEIPAISASSRLHLLNLEHLSVGRLISERQEIAVSFRKMQHLFSRRSMAKCYPRDTAT